MPRPRQCTRRQTRVLRSYRKLFAENRKPKKYEKISFRNICDIISGECLRCALVLITGGTAYAEKSYDIAEIYTVTKPERGTKAVGKYGKAEEVKYILTPVRVETGKYIVEVKKIGDNLYQIKNRFKNKDICIETRYCHEYVSVSKEVVLIINSNYGYTKGKLIFD